MRVMKFFIILITLACVPLLSHAAEVKLTSSTQYLWYQDLLAVDPNKGIEEAAQYLRVNVTKLDQEGKLNIYAYGRATQQLWASEDQRTRQDQDLQGRLYYFYVDYRDAFNEHLDLRAGRTYVNAAAVSGTIDGLYVNLKNLGPVGITVFGGRNVIFQDTTETNAQTDTSMQGNNLMGMSVYLDTIKNTHVEVSYGRKYDDTGVERENVGLDFSTTPIGSMLNFYGRLKYDTISESYNELLLGAKVTPLKDLTLRGEYYESYPTFDTNSVYSVFAVSQYNEKSISAEYQLTNNYRVSVKYAKEDFSGDTTADLYGVGFLARPIKDLTINASFEKRYGYAGDLGGIRLNAEYRISKAAIMAGIDYDDFRREAYAGDDNRKGIAKKYWAGVNYEFTKIISAVVRIENDVNFTYDSSYQGFVAININYSLSTAKK
jgi:hypothetical protein